MKALYIILGIILVIFIGSQIFAWNSQRNIETYPYKVIRNTILSKSRTYEATLFTSVQLSTNAYKESSSKGFSILAVIFFGNGKQKIAMTSPVSMSLDSSMTMMFMVPKSLKKKRYHNQTI
jgi:hypothetical protein